MSCVRGKSAKCVENGVGDMIEWENNKEYFDTIDEVIAKKQRYFSYCKSCFKEEH